MKITGVQCDECGKIGGDAGNWSAVWHMLKKRGWTVDRREHRCPACSAAWRMKLDEDAKRKRGA